MRTKYRDLHEYRVERAKAKAVVDHYGNSLEGHLRNLKDKDFRAELVTNAASDLISNLRPVRLLSSVFGNEQGALGNLAGALLTFKARGFKGKLLAWAATTLGPLIVDRILRSEWLDRWIANTKEATQREEEDLEREDLVDEEVH
ncbi:MAG: hypothetical protein IPH05_05155 [Flavobacteriales bacterium]|nr:hypothetical protein [Flavobacteriales bacterium]